MDKTLKIIVLLKFSLLLFTASIAQTWHTFTPNDFGIGLNLFQLGAKPDQTFKISKYTNDMWFSKDSIALHINNVGHAEIYNADNFPILSSVYAFNAIAITPTKVVFADDNHGLFSYNGSTWSALSGGLGTVTMSSDADTIWCARDGVPYLKIMPMSSELGVSNIKVSASKNGNLWGMNSISDGFLRKYKVDLSFNYYDADTIDSFLDNKNYHLKFSNHSDTMYTSGDLGISLAVGDGFVDSICSANSSNMPNLPIMEFEIDEQHNIWAIFGNTTNLHIPVKIGFYNRTLKAWTQFYDETNSPITFNGTVSIELDTLGNLWVSNKTKLHCLSFSNPPSWLGLKELDKKEGTFSVYPNPSNGDIHISSKNTTLIEKVIVLDAKGKVLQEFSSSPTLHLEIEAGSYFLKIIGENNLEEILPFVLN